MTRQRKPEETYCNFANFKACFVYLFIIKLFYYLPIIIYFRMLHIIRKVFCHWIFRYKSYQVSVLESLNTAPLKPGPYRTNIVVSGSEGKTTIVAIDSESLKHLSVNTGGQRCHFYIITYLRDHVRYALWSFLRWRSLFTSLCKWTKNHK